MDFPYATLSLVASLTVASLWFIDSVVLWWRVRVYERLFRWGVLLLLLGSLFLPAWLSGSAPLLLYYVPVSLAVAWAIWFRKLRRRVQRLLPDQVLFQWTTLPSFLLSGALSGATLFLAFAAARRFQNVTTFAGFLLAAATLGALLAGMKRQARLRQPYMMFCFSRYSVEGESHLAPVGVYADEGIAFLFILPLQLFLGYYAIFGPILMWIVYLIWSALQASWLRWIGSVDNDHRMLALAHELILRDDSLSRWLPKLSIRIEPASRTLRVSGKLPSLTLRHSLAKKLSALGTVNVDEIHIDPRLQPDPWRQLALETSTRH